MNADTHIDTTDLLAYVEANPYGVVYRLKGNPQTPQGGHISTTGSKYPRLMWRSKARRNHYSLIFDRHLGTDYPRLEIKVGSRFRPACEVIAEWTDNQLEGRS